MKKLGKTVDLRCESVRGKPRGITPNPASRNKVVTKKEMLDANRKYIRGIAFAPDGKSIAYTSTGSDIVIKDLNGGILVTLPGQGSRYFESITFGPQGKRVAAIDNTGSVKVWELPSKKLLTTIPSSNGPKIVRFSPDGKTIALGGTGIRILNTSTWQLIKTLKGHISVIYKLAFHPTNSNVLASSSASRSSEIFLWDISKGQASFKFPVKSRSLAPSVAFSPDGKLLAIGKKELEVWELASQKIISSHPGFDIDIKEVAFYRDNKTILFTFDNGFALWDSGAHRLRDIVGGHIKNIKRVAVSPSGKYFATANTSTKVLVWNAHTKKLIHILPHKNPNHPTLAFHPNGRELLLEGNYGEARLFDLLSGKLLKTIQLPKGPRNRNPYSMLFSPDGTKLAIIWDKEMAVLEYPSLKIFKTYTTNGLSIFRFEFSPDGKLIAIATTAAIQAWELQTGKKIIDYASPRYHYDVSFSPNGKYLAAIGNSGKIEILNVPQGTLHRSILGSGSAVAFDPSSQYVAYTQGSNIKLVDLQGKTLVTLSQHKYTVNDLAFLSDGTLLSGASDQSAKLWHCPCVANSTRPCYTGPEGTIGIGFCKKGTQTCGTQGRWGACSDSTPQVEKENQKDDNCDGLRDEDFSDLVVTKLTPPATAKSADKISIEVCLSNQGSKTTQSQEVQVRLYFEYSFTKLTTVSPKLTGETNQPKDLSFFPIQGGVTVCKKVTVTLPSNIISSSHQIGAIVDFANRVKDKNRANNTKVTRITIQ